MKLFTGAIVTETNTFSPIPTGLQAFQIYGVQHGSRAPITTTNEFATLVRWRERAVADGHEIVESIAAVAEPGGKTVRCVYENLRDELLADLERAAPVDVVLLYLHGAMVAEGYDDCEGDMLARVRSIAGVRAIVGAELDLHSHLTEAMLANATAIVAYDEYPHTDIVARGEDLYDLCLEAAHGRVRPVMRAYDCRMTGMYPTTASPMRGWVDGMKGARTAGVLSTSLIHGFPWGDVAEAGTKTLAISDGDEGLAERTAAELGRSLWELRDRIVIRGGGVDEAIDAGLSSAKLPAVLADVADNAGGGAPGDSTFLLRRLIERGIDGVVSGVYYDPVTVDLCFEAGEGAAIDLRIGGKMGVASGMPLDVRARVCGLAPDHTQSSMDDSAPVPFGRSAWIQAHGINIVLASIRGQVFAPDAFTNLGIPLENARFIVVKSSHHFWAKFAPIAGTVLHVDSPGALQLDFAAIPYAKRDAVYWPRVEDPFPAAKLG